MADAYPQLERERDTIFKWARAEDEGFRRTLAQGERLLSDLVRRATEAGTSWISAEDAFRLHDTYGFPYELTKELLAQEGLAVDDQGFDELMEQARAVARGGGGPRHAGGDEHEHVLAFARQAGFATRFVGYEATEWDTVVGALDRDNGRILAKLDESPFYAEGGGQVSDCGVVETSIWPGARRAASSGSATTRRLRWGSPRASCRPASTCTPWWTASGDWRRWPTTPRRTCSMRR